MQTMVPAIQLLNEVSALNERFIGLASAWLHGEKIGRLGRLYLESVKRREVDMGFNLFHLISEVYYRENLHSDILQAIIEPAGSHGQGDRFLRLFLDFLRERCGIALEISNYSNARVLREAGKIDLLICDEFTKKAIIIENKINGAADMHLQLPRYLEKVAVDFGYTCDAIVYVCLNQKKHPDTSGWNEEEREKVGKLLHVVSAYNESEDDLYHGWLQPCIEASDGEVAHVLRQYRQLILKLGRNSMNKPIMTDFYNLMLDKQNHESAVALNAMWNDLGEYRRERLLEAFQSDPHPFKTVFRWSNSVMCFEGLDGIRIKLQADCGSYDRTIVSFWNNDNDPEGKVPGRILQDLGMTDQFPANNGSGVFNRVFHFPSEENALYQFIRDFKEALKKRSSPVGCSTVG